MNLLKYTAVTLLVITASVAEAVPTYLTGNNLKNAINNQTLIGKDWAEFYQPDGKIFGKVRYLFVIYDYTGRWSVSKDPKSGAENRICYRYPGQQGQSEKNTCSRLTLNGNTITHYDLSGKQKNDGVAQRQSGNALDQFK